MIEYMGLYESLQLGLGDGRNRTRVHIDIEEYHIAYYLDLDADPLSTFQSCRPDGPAFDKEK